MNRRSLLRNTPMLAAATTLVSCAGRPANVGSTVADTFSHGVASGDPLAHSVILWTHVRPVGRDIGQSNAIPVTWRVAKDEGMRQLVSHGSASTGADRDFTFKVDAQNLEPDSYYYYQFEAQGELSPVGRTRTLSQSGGKETGRNGSGTGHVRIAVASCANYPFGHFNVYRRIAQQDDLNAVVHLGDYLYEYAPGTYDGNSTTRQHYPDREIVALADYRMRHAQYKTDPDLQTAHQMHPWICVWDDHESTNNTWKNGAQNHNEGEGDWAVRKRAAIRAYHEWMPIREQSMSVAGPFIFRSFRFGDTADLLMLDTRLHGRSEQVERLDQRGLNDPARSLLGTDQLAWLQHQLSESKHRNARWRLLGQQCMFGQLVNEQQQVLNADQWDGYPLERKKILNQLRDQEVDNTVVLTGDIHSSWGVDLCHDPFGNGYNPATGAGSLAVELITSAVTSPAPYGPDEARFREQTRMKNPHVNWVNFQHRGYLVVDLTAERALAEWRLVDTVASLQHSEFIGHSMVAVSGSNRLVDA